MNRQDRFLFRGTPPPLATRLRFPSKFQSCLSLSPAATTQVLDCGGGVDRGTGGDRRRQANDDPIRARKRALRMRMYPRLRWRIALVVTTLIFLDHAGGEGRRGASSFARTPGRLAWAEGRIRDGSVGGMGMLPFLPEEIRRSSRLHPFSSPAYDCFAADFCLALRLRGGAAARGGKRGGGNAKPARKRKTAPVAPKVSEEDIDDGDVDHQEDADDLQGEIGAIAASLERELGDVDAAAKAAGAGATSARGGKRSGTMSLDDNPSVKQAVAGIDVKLRATGKTEEELAAEQQRLFDDMRAKMSSEMARDMAAPEEGGMAEGRGVRKKKGLFEGFDAGSVSPARSARQNDFGGGVELDGFDDDYNALLGMVEGDEGVDEVGTDDGTAVAAGKKRGKASRTGYGMVAGSPEVGDDEESMFEEDEQEKEEIQDDEYSQESKNEAGGKGGGRDADGERDLQYQSDGQEEEDVDQAEARLMDIDDGPVVIPSQWTGAEGADILARELEDVAKLTGEYAGIDDLSSSSSDGMVGGGKKRQRDENEEGEVVQEEGATADQEAMSQDIIFGGSQPRTTPFMEGGGQGDSNSTDADTDPEPDPGWDGFWKDADYEYSVHKWVAGTEGKEQPGKLPNMTNAEYFRELEAEGNRYLKHLGIPPEIHPSNRNGTMPNLTKAQMREIFGSEVSDDSEEGRGSSSNVSSSDFVYDVPTNETLEERRIRQDKEILETGATRDFRRAWEGESSDTWEDSEDNRNLTEGAPRIKRRRIPGSPTERMEQHFESQSMLGLIPHSRPGKGVGIGMAPPIRTVADMIDQAGFAGQEYVYTTYGRFKNVPPMRDCMADKLDGGNRTGGYGHLVSELNWSPEERVRLNITADTRLESRSGMSGVHFRKIVSAREFLENTPVNYHTVKPDPRIPSADWHNFEDSDDRKKGF